MASFEQLAKESKASQGEQELLWLLNRIDATVKPEVIVEIGVHQGYSMETWHKAFNPRIMVGIESDLHDLKWDLEPNSKIIVGDSHDHEIAESLVEELDGHMIDFLFIDGDHMYKGVKQDFEMYAPLVKKGGIIAFDDIDLYDNESVEVYKFWKELTDSGKWGWSMTSADSNGIGVLYV
jgi:predicted O-methyltransferase YrrM